MKVSSGSPFLAFASVMIIASVPFFTRLLASLKFSLATAYRSHI
jgi:hypothetical protein